MRQELLKGLTEEQVAKIKACKNQRMQISGRRNNRFGAVRLHGIYWIYKKCDHPDTAEGIPQTKGTFF